MYGFKRIWINCRITLPPCHLQTPNDIVLHFLNSQRVHIRRRHYTITNAFRTRIGKNLPQPLLTKQKTLQQARAVKFEFRQKL